MTKTGYFRHKMYERFNEGRYREAADIGESLLKEHWNNHTMWSKDYSDDLFNAALAHEKINNLGRAAELYSDSARQIGTGIRVDDLAMLVDRLTNLGFILRSQGLIFPSALIYAQIIDACSKIKDKYPLKLADAFYNMGNVLATDGQNDEALDQHKRSLEIRKDIYMEASDDSICRDIVNSCHSIAFVYEDEEEFELAIEYAQMAMIYSDSTNHANCCHYIAELYEANEMIDDAIFYYKMTLEDLKGITGRSHSSYFNVSSKLAALLSGSGKLEEALDISLKMLSYIEKSNISSSLAYINCMRNIAILYDDIGDDDLAEDYMLRALALRVKFLDDASYEIIFLLKKYITKKRKDDAIGMLVLAMLKIGDEHFNIDKAVNALISVFDDINIPRELYHDFYRPYINKWHRWEEDL